MAALTPPLSVNMYLVSCIFLCHILTGGVLGRPDGSSPSTGDESLIVAVDGTDPDTGDKIRQKLVKMIEGKHKEGCLKADDMICPRKEVTFWHYTRETWDNPTLLDPNNPEVPEYAPTADWKVLVHGFTKDKDKAINEVLRPEYFKRGEYNILSVDWSPLAQDQCYLEAALSIPTVGHCVAFTLTRLMMRLHRLTWLWPWDLRFRRRLFSNLHVLGHSMGAHVSAWASAEMAGLYRLTEFDPAMPLFTNHDSLLKKGVAQVVDVWHTNSDLNGRESADGTVDIYFNDEVDQPGCHCNASCSHLRCVQYYGDTLTTKTGSLSAFPCSGWSDYRKDNCPVPTAADLAEFGENFTPGTTGKYLAFTNFNSPFIVPPEQYLDEESFRSFEKTHDEDCEKHDVIAFFADLFNL